jgi:hypothetical protein
VIGSSPVTSGTMSGTSAATDETGTGGTEEELRERRANNVPSSSAITMRGVINRSGMEPIAGTVRQRKKTVIWFVWFASFIWLNQTNQIDQMNQKDQTDRACATREDYRSSRGPT